MGYTWAFRSWTLSNISPHSHHCSFSRALIPQAFLYHSAVPISDLDEWGEPLTLPRTSWCGMVDVSCFSWSGKDNYRSPPSPREEQVFHTGGQVSRCILGPECTELWWEWDFFPTFCPYQGSRTPCILARKIWWVLTPSLVLAHFNTIQTSGIQLHPGHKKLSTW